MLRRERNSPIRFSYELDQESLTVQLVVATLQSSEEDREDVADAEYEPHNSVQEEEAPEPDIAHGGNVATKRRRIVEDDEE